MNRPQVVPAFRDSSKMACIICGRELDINSHDPEQRVAEIDDSGAWCNRCAWVLNHEGETAAIPRRQ